MPRPKLNRERINITLPPWLIKQLDEAAVALETTRSHAIDAACRFWLRQNPPPKRKRGGK